jgi:type III pantothenate kinase
MLLAVDVGNTNTVFAAFAENGGTACRWRLATDARRTADEYALSASWFLERRGLGLAKITAFVIGSVVPAATAGLMRFAARYLPQAGEPLVVGAPGVDPGVEICLDYPAEVGADRLVNVLAAHRLYRRECIVLDFGTATTFDVTDAAGRYLGGVIAPGVEASMAGLHKAAAKLPAAEFRRPSAVVGKNTASALASGMFYGYLSMVEGLVRRIREERGTRAFVVATGGLAEAYAEASDAIDDYAPDLTMQGLYYVYGINRKKPA